jgi:acyl carrier protein
VTPQQAREQIGPALTRAAPGSDIDTIDPGTDLRDALDLDSLDFLRFIEILSETSGRRIEEDNYPELATLDSSIRFLAARLPSQRAGFTWQRAALRRFTSHPSGCTG